MRRHFAVLVLLVPIFAALPVPRLLAEPRSLGLAECYRLALRHALEVPIAEQDILRARARYLQTLGTFLPKVSLNASEVLQEPVNTTGTFSSSFGSVSQPSVALTATVPLFQGLREVAVIRYAGSDRELHKARKREAERLLFIDVARAFYMTVKIERDIVRTGEMIRVYGERIEELSRRVDIGKSRESERESQKAELAFLTAELSRLRGDRAVAYEVMSYFTGLAPHPRLNDGIAPGHVSQTLAAYVGMAVDRADVKAAAKQVELARGDKMAARSSLLPDANLQSNYYPYRSGFLKDSHWDLTLNLNVPVFDFQSTGALKESGSMLRQAELRLERARRLAESEIRRNYAAYAGSRATFAAYQAAVGEAQKSYALLKGDYALGLVTNLDILQAQKSLLDAMRSRDEALVTERLDWAELQAAAGVLP